MIRYLTRSQIDVDKYNECVTRAVNSRIYAYSWYLDSVTDNWDVLVLDDYKAVMPLPWRMKYFVRYIYLPAWVQQLGVFYIEDGAEEIVQLFLNSIPKKFKFVELYLNSKNKIINASISARANYILSLEKPYDQLVNNYKKGRKSDLKNAKKHGVIFKEVLDAFRLINMFQLEKGNDVQRKPADYQKLKVLTDILIKHKKASVVEVYTKENILTGGAIFLIDSKRITYLFSASNTEGREMNSITLLIDSLISRYANSACIFDFEGSMMENLASFFRSFGSVKEDYYHYKRFRF